MAVYAVVVRVSCAPQRVFVTTLLLVRIRAKAKVKNAVLFVVLIAACAIREKLVPQVPVLRSHQMSAVLIAL